MNKGTSIPLTFKYSIALELVNRVNHSGYFSILFTYHIASDTTGGEKSLHPFILLHILNLGAIPICNEYRREFVSQLVNLLSCYRTQKVWHNLGF